MPYPLAIGSVLFKNYSLFLRSYSWAKKRNRSVDLLFVFCVLFLMAIGALVLALINWVTCGFVNLTAVGFSPQFYNSSKPKYLILTFFQRAHSMNHNKQAAVSFSHKVP